MQTLKQNKEFRRLYYQGKSQASSCLVTYAIKPKKPASRYGITTSKKIGGAVERNRARRVIRAALREAAPKIEGSWDLVFVARSKTGRVKMQAVLGDMLRQLNALGVIHEENQ